MQYLLHCLIWNLLLVTGAALILWSLSATRALLERPALRHFFWLLVLLKFITPPLVPVPLLPAVENNTELSGEVLPISQHTSNDLPLVGEQSAVSAVEIEEPVAGASGLDWSRVGFIAMITVVCLSLFVTVVLWSLAVLQLHRLRRVLVNFRDAPVREMKALNSVCQTFKITKIPVLTVVDAACSPMVWVDFRRSTIILPRVFAESASDEQLRQVLAHEMAHLVRYDHISNLLAFFVTSLFWWNPIAWLARRELLMASETCCDALAMERSPGSRQSYAETLLAAVDYAAQHQAVTSGLVAQFGESQSLKRRIEMIASSQVKATLSGPTRLIVLSFGLLALILIPVQAQENPPTQTPGALNPTTAENTENTPVAEQSEKEDEDEAFPNTAEKNMPTIADAKLISWSGDESSCRAYFFETEQTAESFAKLVATFKIATRFQVVITEDEPSLTDYDKKRMVMPPNHARQLELDSDNNYVLLYGKRKDHARVEALIRALLDIE